MQSTERNQPPFRTPPPPEPDKTVEPPKLDVPEPPPPRTIGGRAIPPIPGPRLIRKERCTYHIRFRRGWFGRLVIQVELVVHWYELLNQDKGSVKSAIEWRDANKQELDEIARGYFQTERSAR